MLWSLLFTLLVGRLYATQQTDLCNTQNINLTDKNASQSSNYKNNDIAYYANRAFDGDNSACSQTNQDMSSKWKIDLQAVYNISCISIYNIKQDNGAPEITGAKSYIGNSPQNDRKNTLAYKITNFEQGQTNNFKLSKSVFGRYVTVIIENKPMVLLEVNITGSVLEPPFCSE